jgi:myo-inositol-1(or 4)-monophosphatase
VSGQAGAPISNTDLLALAVEVAREAADLVRDARRDDDVTVAATKSSPIDIVTQVDRDSEDLVRRRIREARPHDGFLGEEGHDDAGSSGVRWIVDPIDGTVNFLYGLPQYAVSVAAERDGEVVAGIVLDVAKRVEYTAARTDGPGTSGGAVRSERTGRAIAVRDVVPLELSLIGTGFHYTRELRTLQAQAAARLLPQIRDIRRLGSCALDLCHVAEGLLDGYLEEGVNPWDYAAGALVAQGAGATVELREGVGGKTLILCAPAAGYRALAEVVEASGFVKQGRE